MNPCPQCGASLGEGASGCASCGWKASKKTLWIVLGSILGVLILVCCGIGAWFFNLGRNMVTNMQSHGTPPVLALYRLQVLRYGVRHGALPKDLVHATSVPVETESGEPIRLDLPPSPDGGPSDSWMRGVRYTPGEGGTFELRSAGPDGTFDNGDDITLSGSLSDDQMQVFEELRTRTEEFAKNLLDGFPEFMREGNAQGNVNIKIGTPKLAVPEEKMGDGAEPPAGEGADAPADGDAESPPLDGGADGDASGDK